MKTSDERLGIWYNNEKSDFSLKHVWSYVKIHGSCKYRDWLSDADDSVYVEIIDVVLS